MPTVPHITSQHWHLPISRRALMTAQSSSMPIFLAQVRAIRLLVDRHEEVAPSTVVPALQARLPHRHSACLRLCPTWMQH